MEIKFRGVSKSGEMIYGSLVNNCAGISHMPGQNTRTWIITSAFGNGGWFNIRGRKYVKPETIGQFTGYTNSDGGCIYSGDIIKGFNRNYEVEFGECDASIQGSVCEAPMLAYHIGGTPLNLLDKYEVLGNKHQNPELLNA